jgi:hypothetical protein
MRRAAREWHYVVGAPLFLGSTVDQAVHDLSFFTTDDVTRSAALRYLKKGDGTVLQQIAAWEFL